MLLRSAVFILAAFACCFTGQAQDPPDVAADQVKFFDREVLPLLKQNCLKCHAGESPKGGLLLTSRAAILKGGESGTAVDLNDITGSLLIQAINYDGYEMPPTGKMSPQQIAVLTKWVELKLAWPKDLHEIEFEVEAGPPQVNEESKKFWSFQPVKQPQVPRVANTGNNPIDAFIRRDLAEAGLQPSPAAKAAELVRRMYYDLLGLPPEPAEVEKWAARISSGADGLNQAGIAELTNDLLQSPHYGEQWGRHWLDLVRYAETNS